MVALMGTSSGFAREECKSGAGGVDQKKKTLTTESQRTQRQEKKQEIELIHVLFLAFVRSVFSLTLWLMSALVGAHPGRNAVTLVAARSVGCEEAVQ
jgi:hypothetical protein